MNSTDTGKTKTFVPGQRVKWITWYGFGAQVSYGTFRGMYDATTAKVDMDSYGGVEGAVAIDSLSDGTDGPRAGDAVTGY